jgi:hypothetical protein
MRSLKVAPCFIVVNDSQMGKDQLASLDLGERLHPEDFPKWVIPDINDIRFSWVDESAAVSVNVLLFKKLNISCINYWYILIILVVQ